MVLDTLHQGLCKSLDRLTGRDHHASWAKTAVLITIKIWDSPRNDRTPILDFQRWFTESFMSEEDPKPSMRQLDLHDCEIIALHNAVAIYPGETDAEMFSREWSRRERYRFCSMVVQHAKNLNKESRA
ncbi:hypothetical protein BPOR_0236g00010 [Botrytis porri]|uniref:Uncharacterized protein n=1 Tax=Botrytis porri TaxID=87229 RepID=A0A4Z1KP93_9HELO|nr:hypothetical protein BPOR_0236g00010 [Botrytis porri]